MNIGFLVQWQAYMSGGSAINLTGQYCPQACLGTYLILLLQEQTSINSVTPSLSVFEKA